MKKHFLTFFLVLALAAAAFAQGVTVDLKNLQTHVGYLASDSLEGRRTGETGATAAAGYAANLFARYKLKPGASTDAGKGNYLQKFPYTVGVEPASGNAFSVMEKGGTPVKIGDADVRTVLFSPNAATQNAAVVFAGFGIESTELGFNDYAGLDVAGKVILIFDGSPDADSMRSPFARFSLHAKAKLAKDKGAIALIVISREDKFENDRNARAKYDQSQGETAIPAFAVSRAAAAKMLGAKEPELKTIESMVAMKKDTAARFSVRFEGSLPNVSYRVDLIKKTADAYNVIGILEGTDPQLKSEAIVIGAHYDHLGRGGAGSLAVNSTEIHHGADDNASGSAALLELARYFAKAKNNKRTLIFIAFSGEEEGLLGSKHYVNNPVFPLDKTVAMFNMDMIGRLTEDKLTVGGIGSAAEWRDLVNSKNEIIVSPRNAGSNFAETKRDSVRRFSLQLSEDGFGPSDHASFYGKQIPVLFFFTGTHNDYHKPSDTADKINYAGLFKITQYVGELVQYVDANMKQRPTYKVAQTSGQGDGRRGFNVTIGVVPGYGEANDGMNVDGVRDGSPAAVAGIKAGDKIVKFAGKDVRNVQDYTFILGDLKADTEYEIVVNRAGQVIILKVKPAARR